MTLKSILIYACTLCKTKDKNWLDNGIRRPSPMYHLCSHNSYFLGGDGSSQYIVPEVIVLSILQVGHSAADTVLVLHISMAKLNKYR